MKEVESIFLCERATFFFRVRLRPLHLHSNYLYILTCYIIFEYVSDDPCLRFSEISTPTVAAPYAFSNAVGFFNISLLHNNTLLLSGMFLLISFDSQLDACLWVSQAACVRELGPNNAANIFHYYKV